MIGRRQAGCRGACLTFTLERPESFAPGQSILVVWPYPTLLAALAPVCLGLFSVVFMRQEIRSV